MATNTKKCEEMSKEQRKRSEEDPDWMYKPILNGAFNKLTKEEIEVCGNGET